LIQANALTLSKVYRWNDFYCIFTSPINIEIDALRANIIRIISLFIQNIYLFTLFTNLA